MRIHPLHSIDFLTAHMRDTGEYPDPTRCTGQSTALALEYLATAIRNPYKAVVVFDHHDTVASHVALVGQIYQLTKLLNLEHMHHDARQQLVCFGCPPSKASKRIYPVGREIPAGYGVPRGGCVPHPLVGTRVIARVPRP